MISSMLPDLRLVDPPPQRAGGAVALARVLRHAYILIAAFCWLSMGSAQGATPPTARLKAAFAPFSVDGTSYRAATTAREFSDALFASVMEFDGVEWVERAELHLLKEELELSKSGFGNLESQARAGRWSECDLLISGRFEDGSGPGSTLVMEIVNPRRGELLISTNLVLNARLSKDSKAVLEELDRVAGVTRQLLSAAGDLAAHQRQLVSIALVTTFNQLQPQKGMHPPNVPKLISDTFQRQLQSKTGLRSWRHSRHQQGREEARLIRSGLLGSESRDWSRLNSSYVVVNATNVAVFARSGPDAGWTDRYDLRFAILDVLGRVHLEVRTNLRNAELVEAAEELTKRALSLATNRAPQQVPEGSIQRFASLVSEWSGERSYNLADYDGRLSWLEHVGGLEIAAQLGWQVPSIRAQVLRATYDAVTGLPRQPSFREHLEMHDRWQMLLDEFTSADHPQRAETLQVLGARKLHQLALSSLKLVETVRIGSQTFGDFPPSIVQALGVRLERQFLQRARLTLRAPDYTPADGQWMIADRLLTASEVVALSQEIAGVNATATRRDAIPRQPSPSSAAPVAADPYSFTNLPRFPRAVDSDKTVVTDLRMASSLPPRLDLPIESFTPEGLSSVKGLIDMVCGGDEVFLLLGQEEEVQDLERERNLGVKLGLAKVPVTRIWAFNPALGRTRKVASLPLTNRFQRLAWHENRLWAAGDFIVSVDPRSLEAGRRYNLPDGFRSPLLGFTWHEGGLVVASDREIAQLDLKSGQWNAVAVPPVMGGGRLVSSARGVFLASNRHFGFIERSALQAITPQLFREGVPPEGFASLIEPSCFGGIWVAGQYGLMHYDASNRFGGFQAPSPQYPAFDNFSAFASYCKRQRESHASETNYHPFRPLSRINGPIQDVRGDGEFLWVVTAGGEPMGYGRRFMLMHQPTRQWIGYVPVPSIGSPIALGNGYLWVLNSPFNSGDGFQLGRVDCRRAYATPRSSWVDSQPDRAELDLQVSSWSLKERILDAFVAGSYSNCVRLIGLVSPLDEDPQLGFILALAAQSPEVMRPDLSVGALRSLMVREPETYPWHLLAKANLGGAQLMLSQSSAKAAGGTPTSGASLPFELAEATLRDPAVVKTLFSQFDLDANGRLDLDELRAMDIEREAYAPHIAVRLFLVDVNRNQELDLTEQHLLYAALRAQAEPLLLPYDLDRDGGVSRVEAKAMHEKFPNTVGGFWPLHRFDSIDLDQDGKLSIREISWTLTTLFVQRATPSDGFGNRIYPELPQLPSYDSNSNRLWDPPEVAARLKQIYQLNRTATNAPSGLQALTKP
ncbi:MAG: hypothetical protein JNN07_07895 [Verrucomicrobiales bacterium]|nr:hypothetical protein [Verrucomicrobiales bacterium]